MRGCGFPARLFALQSSCLSSEGEEFSGAAACAALLRLQVVPGMVQPLLRACCSALVPFEHDLLIQETYCSLLSDVLGRTRALRSAPSARRGAFCGLGLVIAGVISQIEPRYLLCGVIKEL